MNFENDGCTGWLDGWPGGPSWVACCDAHDWVMHNNSDVMEFLRGGVELAWCVSQVDAFQGVLVGIGALSPVALWFFIFGNKKKGR